jgi:pyruvate dehydrogenase E2 component (dihydrolipoamide acetyltransferase)
VTDFTLPELGENVTAGDVLRVLVKPGDALTKDQPVLELETDKATIEVPSTVAGKVKDVKVKPGDKVKVGQPILSVDDAVGVAEARPVGGPAEKPAVGANTSEKVPADGGLEQHVEGDKRPTPDKPGVKPQTADTSPAAADDNGRGQARGNVVDITRGARPAAEAAAPEFPVAAAAPSVRRMARELGVDINQVPGTGPSGRISTDDVKTHAKRLISQSSAAARSGTAIPSEPLPDFTRWGEVERQPMRAVRRKTAEHLSAAWISVPHVTQFDLAAVDGLDELRMRYAKPVEAAGGNLTVTAIAVKIVAAALKVFPQFNSSVDVAAGEIIYKKYVHIGVAVDTDRGLLVPVIRNADRKNILQISVELAQLSEKARTRKILLDEMQGGCFSVSNLGGIGGTYFTPIVNAPEVAILGISRTRTEPVYQKDSGQFVPRQMLPLSLSYDHRVIDGADGIRFLRWVAEAFEQPFLLALQG